MPTGPEARKAFHRNRINSERNGVRKFWWAAWWVMAELKHLARRDAPKAHTDGLSLTKQLCTIAEDLNKKHLKYLKAQKGGDGRV